MAPLVLEGDTLGQKHKYYNKLVHEAVSNKQAIEPTLSDEDDLQNLLKIDVACKTRNVEFLLNVLKSEDSLYVSRAIKNSKWMITDKQYAHIVNPEYLHTQLSPEMTSTAFNKLMLSVRLNLKDPDRVENFYKYIAERNCEASYKWLQHCSVTFIENEIKNDDYDIPIHIICRLVEKSLSIFEKFVKTSSYSRYQLIIDTIFLATINPEKYLDVLETVDNQRMGIKFNAKATATFMTRCPNRILDKFEFYARALHLPTFVKYIKKQQDIKAFLLNLAKNDKMKWFFTYSYMEHFIKHMPKESKFEFVKTIFIDKEPFKGQEDEFAEDCESYKMCRMQCSMAMPRNTSNQNYQWYKFAPFEVAFTDLKKLIRAESSPPVRNSMLQVLLTCAGRNMTHIRAVLKFYHQKHINEPFKFKIQFVNTFISKCDTHEFDDETWGLLYQLYQSMEVYVKSENSVQSCIKSIIIRHVIRGEKVPDIINEKFTFDTLKPYQHRLKKQEEKEAVFGYLYNFMVAKNDTLKITTKTELEDAIRLCENLLNLLNDWKKELQNYPYVIKQVKELIRIKQDSSWDTSMELLYNVNQSWKKTLFEESISLCPTLGVCVNALKHDPGLLMRHRTEVETILKNDALLLTVLLSKVRIYWAASLAEEWKTLYLNSLEKPEGQKALVIGLCTLLNQKQLNDVAKKYAPAESKIDWSEIDEIILSIQKLIAKNMSKARPLPSLDNVLSYAKGDYLQFTVPSLNSILSKMSANKIRQYLPKLLDAPVSLQKFGVRHALGKLNSSELKPIFTEIWNSTKNSTIRTVLFTNTHSLLSKEKNPVHIKDIWELLSMFIDNLSSEENQLIYKKLEKAEDAPLCIRPQVFMKSYTFLKSLPAKANCESILRNMEYKAPDMMESLDDEFVVNIMLKDFDKKFSKSHDTMYDNLRMVASFILSCKDEEKAARRYELFLAPLIDRNLSLWNYAHDGVYHVKINLKAILTNFFYFMDDYCLEKKMIIPVKTFEKIKSKLEAALSPQKNYVFLTTWKLGVEFIKLVDENKDVLTKINIDKNDSRSVELEKIYRELHLKIAPGFAKNCVRLLKEDLDHFYPSLHILFSQALDSFFKSFMPYAVLQWTEQIEYLKCILLCSNDKEVYFVVYYVMQSLLKNINLNIEAEIKKYKEICEILYSHPSDELKMHYFQLFNDCDVEVGIEQ